MRGNLLAAFDYDCGRLRQRRAYEHHRPRASAAAAERHAVTIAFDHANSIKRNAEEIGENLRVGRSMAHAEVQRARDNRYGAVGLEMNGTELLAWGRGHLEIAANPYSAQETPFFTFAFAPFEIG